MPLTASDTNPVRCLVFQDMTLDERQEALELMERKSYPAGETILREGNAIQMLWVLTHGRCEVVKSIKTGSEQQLAVLEPGAVFGEMSFFNPAPHSASVRALSEVEVLRLPREQYERLVERGSSAAYKIAASTAAVLAQRLRKMDEWTCELVDGSAGVSKDRRKEWREFRARLYSDWEF